MKIDDNKVLLIAPAFVALNLALSHQKPGWSSG